MEADAVGAEVGEVVHRVDRVERGRVSWPKGSRPRLPTVHRPNVNWSADAAATTRSRSCGPMFPDGRRRGNMRPMTTTSPPPRTAAASPASPVAATPAPPYAAPPALRRRTPRRHPGTPAGSRRAAWQRRNETDYIFDFWTAFGWTILTCGIYGLYVTYQLVRRSRDHNLRRIELLDAATTLAWEQAQSKALADELRPGFERIASQMAVLRAKAGEFRDPTMWLVIGIAAAVLTGIGGLVVHIIVYILLDGDLVAHDHAEGAIENELSAIYTRLGAPVAAPEPARLKAPHNYVGRIIATILTCGIYGLWWEYDVMVEGNRHFEENWRWEDDLAQSVQQLIAA